MEILKVGNEFSEHRLYNGDEETALESGTFSLRSLPFSPTSRVSQLQ
jgi:hypothetical protein